MKKIVIGTLILTVGIVLGGCQQKVDTTKSIDGKSDQSMNSKNTEESATAQSSSSSQNNEFDISLEEAFEKYSETYPNTEITSVEIDQSFGEYYYDIEGVDDNNEYSIRVKADTGKMSKEREEVLDKDEQNGVKKKEEAIDTKNVLSIKEASTIAEKEAGAGSAKEWTLEKELGITYWEVKVIDNSKEYEIKINAQDGKILERSED